MNVSDSFVILPSYDVEILLPLKIWRPLYIDHLLKKVIFLFIEV